MTHENLNLKCHTDILLNKIYRNIGISYEASNLLNEFLKNIYFCIIHSYINYANSAWVSSYKTSNPVKTKTSNYMS